MLQYIFIAPVVGYGYTHNRKKKLHSISLPWAYKVFECIHFSLWPIIKISIWTPRYSWNTA